MRRSRAAAAAAALAFLATAQGHPSHVTGILHLSLGKPPAIAGSILPISTGGSTALALWPTGPGSIRGDDLVAPVVKVPVATGVVGATQGAIGFAGMRVVPPPPPERPLVAVATYDNGVALHDPRTFTLLGFLGIGGPPGDVAFSPPGSIYAPDTDGTLLTSVTREPWSIAQTGGVPEGNEVAVDPRNGDVFVSDRDFGTHGALTRVAPDGSVRTVVTGETAEGLALDAARGRIYVGNVNDGTVAQVDVATMKVQRKIRSVPRTFGLALDARARRLYVVANMSPSMRSGGGYVEAIDLRPPHGKPVARSANLTFPIGIVLDAPRHRVFVTDEAADAVYVLDARTLRRLREPLRTCETPWRPSMHDGRLYVPCAGSDDVDVFDLRTLQRVRGAPFPTGGFPLSVAQWP